MVGFVRRAGGSGKTFVMCVQNLWPCFTQNLKTFLITSNLKDDFFKSI
jgi:hypothetical protein